MFPTLCKLENLSEVKTKKINIANGFLKFVKTGKAVNCTIYLENLGTGMSYTDGSVLCNFPEDFVPNPEYMNMEFALITTEKNNRNGSTRLIPLNSGMTIWGASGKNFFEIKGTASYYI